MERVNRKFLGVAASTAIAVGNFVVPAAEASNEHVLARADRRAALTKVGGHAVQGTESTVIDGGTAAEVIPAGCSSSAGKFVRHGPRSRREVALTFDDGPSARQTPKILDILNHFGVHATFFAEGQHVHGREKLMTDILASGDEIGNHSYTHPKHPDYRELARTSHRIRQATGFEPCLYRPPYGNMSSGVTSMAGSLGLEVVKWDASSRDDKHPGASAIRANVLRKARPGSIILMHDGGHHPQTVKALPGIIRGLERRGFGLTTATELLGGRYIYK